MAFLFSIFLNAQELPPVTSYSPELYHAGNQNWSISQSNDKYIFVANNEGLLEFNGATWQLYSSPNQTVVRSVEVVDDHIYTGCYMDFGFWKRNEFGKLIYTSLTQKLNIPLIEDEQFWKILELNDWILFQSLNRIYLYNTSNEEYKIIETETAFANMSKVDDKIYFQKANKGIYKIENGNEQIVSNHTDIIDNTVVNIFEKDNGLLILTQDNGFFILKNGSPIKWNIPANDIISDESIYSAIQLENSTYALGTISNGLLHIDENGEVNYKLNHANGLNNNTVLSLFEDADNNIWLGLDNGINSVNINSPFKIFNDSKGTIGTVYASLVFNDKLYLGTNQGLFYKSTSKNEDFQFVENTQGQVWFLGNIAGELFCGHNRGTFIISKNKVSQQIFNSPGTWNVKAIKGVSELLIQGNYNGLNILEKKNGKWNFRNKIEGFDNSSRYFELYNDYVFVNHEYKGVFKLKLDEEFVKVKNVEIEKSIIKGIGSSIVKFNDELLYTSKSGVYKYDINENTFVEDTSINTLFSDEEDLKFGFIDIYNDQNKLWTSLDDYIVYITTGNISNKPLKYRIPISINVRNGVTGFENLTRVDEQSLLIGTSNGYVIFNENNMSDDTNFMVSINNIQNVRLNTPSEDIVLSTEGVFKSKQNGFKFSFSIRNFNKLAEVEYQYQLEGLYNEWSNWTKETSHLFDNLPSGDYIFNVKGRVGGILTDNIASYSFKIDKPWYASNVMLLFYGLAILVFSLMMHNIYKNYYKKQQEELIVKSEKELELKELENQKQLMSFKNEKLEQDIDNKNRELAISTMSLIKKNEFLNSIKNELKKAKSEINLKSVINIIDKNLNNTDDWEFFEKAFNNADKDFLKKIKAKHEALTPNDLRLCAYLRLNLSSKEIAPLLNISPRSVEVKRYRLRKKMSLPHESSLTNYILEI